MGYSYRDCLSEEIEILQLMLYREEFVQDPSARKHCEPLLDKLEAVSYTHLTLPTNREV